MDSLFSNIDPALISAIMSDPEIVTLMSRPDIQQKMQMAASNPSLLSGMAQDPDIQRLIQKFQSLGLNPNSLIGSGPSPIPNPWSTPTSSVAPSAGSVIHISSKAQFDSLIRSSHNKLVAVDYTASWCGPCKFISPHFDRFASKYADHAVFLKVDVDKNQDIARERGIRSMPTFQFFVDGSVVAEFSGADSDKLENTISRHYERIQKKTNAISVKPSPYKHIPLKPEEIVSFQQCKFDVIKQKIMEFNGLPDCEKPLDANELQCLAGLVDVIADRKSFHRNTVSAEQKQLIVKTLQTWKSIHLPPLLNLLRMAIFHSSMDTWITVANLSQLLKSCDSNADCQLAALRMICNLFVRVSLRTVLIDNCESILELIRPLQSSKIGAIRSAYINVIINYAIIICDDHMQTNINAQSGKIQLLSVCADALQCAEDEKIAQRLLIIAGTLLYRDVTSKSIGQSLQLGDVCTQVAGHYPSAEINEICSEVKKTLDDDDN